MVLLRNQDALLPLSPQSGSIAVIGSHADKGVVTGGGSSAVVPRGGSAVTGVVPTTWPGPRIYQPSAPLAAIAKRTHGKVSYASGDDIAAAAKLAAQSKVAVVFVTQWTSESFDVPTMALPGNQDALVAAVAKANPHTIVVLENNGPVGMPWLDNVGAVMDAWYPGARGGEAIARLLFGEVAPSGHLPVTWPRDESQLPRATIPGAGLAEIGLTPQGEPAASVDYNIEGADVGYRWFQKRGITPLFPFGHGLTYTQFDYGKPTLTQADGTVKMTLQRHQHRQARRGRRAAAVRHAAGQGPHAAAGRMAAGDVEARPDAPGNHHRQRHSNGEFRRGHPRLETRRRQLPFRAGSIGREFRRRGDRCSWPRPIAP